MRAALLLMLVLLAGCFGPGISCYSAEVVSWHDPALFSALEANTTLEGVPLQGAQNASIAELGAERVWFLAYDTGLRMDADGWMRGQFRSAPDEDDLHRATLAFLENATDLDATGREHAANGFIASRDDGSAVFYEAPPQAWRLGKAFDASGATLADLGSRGDTWKWELVWPAKHVDIEGLPIRVDARGAATIEDRDAFRGLDTEEAVIERVTRRLVNAGYPAPEDPKIISGSC